MNADEMDRLKTRLAEVRATVGGPRTAVSAPWSAETVAEVPEATPGGPCPFCEIVAGRAPATILEDWPDAMVIVPLNPVVRGHVIVIPKTHVPDFAANARITVRVIALTCSYVTEWGVGDCNLITSRGAAATQSVPHLHLHVVPRVEDDGLHLPWTGQTIEATTTKDGS